MRAPARLFASTVLASVLVDQLVKLWVRSALVPGESLHLPWPGVFEITLAYNRGVAFGLLQGFGVYLFPIAVAISVGAFLYSLWHPREPWSLHLALALVAGGALGNLIDRLALGKVTDMFWIRLIDFPVFNVADSCITVGTAMLIWRSWRSAAEHPERARAAQPNPGEGEPRTGEG
ncbi:MAG: signal peptidase II [Fimbriimonadales bacterium]|nr:signal peptidase II [Fimbriimonadales bacterium]